MYVSSSSAAWARWVGSEVPSVTFVSEENGGASLYNFRNKTLDSEFGASKAFANIVFSTESVPTAATKFRIALSHIASAVS